MLLHYFLLVASFMKFTIGNQTIWLDDLEHNLANGAPISIYDDIPDLNKTAMEIYSENTLDINWNGMNDFLDHLSETDNATLAKREDLLGVIINAIDPSKATNSDKLAKREESCEQGYTRSLYSRLTNWRTIRSLSSNIREFYYTYATAMIDNASGLASLGYSVAVDLKNRSNKQSCNGGSDWFDVYNKDGSKHTYLVAIAPWTTGKNCDTTATSGMLKEMTTWILDKAQEEHLSAWCSRYDNGGSWHADVRFLKWEDTYFCHQNIWDIPCQST
ncbi:hypothetical protein SCEN_P00160 [Saccharomyces cerevisiae]|nr:hypothetical protein SCEN_P00160 [Saccharomyces cerevisiae]WPD63421.1 hypothetical protein QO155_005344 [Saccharomyces cerevisiae]